MSQATRRPWRVRHLSNDGVNAWHVYGPADDEWVAECGIGGNSKACADAIALSYNTHPDLLQALEAVQKLFATPGYYIGTREGADPLAIDATMILVAQAVRAAKGE